MEEKTTYRFSDEGARQSKQNILLIVVLFPVLLAMFFSINPALGLSSTGLAVYITLVVLVDGLMIISAAVTLRKMRELTVTLSDEALERAGGKFVEKVSYHDISRLDIHQKPKGQIAYLQLETAAGKVINFYGLEQMEALTQQLEDRILDKARVHRKRQAIDWSNPLLFIAIACVTAVVLLWIQGLSKYANNVFNTFLQFALGAYFLAFRPMSRSGGKRFEKFETIVGVTLIVLSVILLALSIFTIAGLGA